MMVAMIIHPQVSKPQAYTHTAGERRRRSNPAPNKHPASAFDHSGTALHSKLSPLNGANTERNNVELPPWVKMSVHVRWTAQKVSLNASPPPSTMLKMAPPPVRAPVTSAASWFVPRPDVASVPRFHSKIEPELKAKVLPKFSLPTAPGARAPPLPIMAAPLKVPLPSCVPEMSASVSRVRVARASPPPTNDK